MPHEGACKKSVFLAVADANPRHKYFGRWSPHDFLKERVVVHIGDVDPKPRPFGQLQYAFVALAKVPLDVLLNGHFCFVVEVAEVYVGKVGPTEGLEVLCHVAQKINLLKG